MCQQTVAVSQEPLSVSQDPATQAHDCDELIALFNGLFVDSHNTELVRGDDEPIYLPADAEHPHHRIVFAHGYFASALHEISHWLIAGPQRRLLEDFGYWYRPDGRTADEQAEFEKVEVKPQALEWIIARACGFYFRISCDNLNGEATDTRAFKDNVYAQVLRYLEQGLSDRAQRLVDGLCQHYHQPTLSASLFDRRDLDW
ncbi:elongation factor P hydroxylase [Motiliproteus sp.]|uniref:elongation factor P hydroxylase n=1 Tax=Motiliproteus sp. TaxID=1898955 RepID=UPI003BA9A66D